MKFLLNKRGDYEEIISAGIDIGTSTTKIVISKFSIRNVSGVGQVPKIEITEKKILYQSPIYRTPLLTETTIDTKRIQEIVKNEYKNAGVKNEEIQTGAVIITGETANKQNAKTFVHQLSNLVGEFLVATAGPDLEGIIAAKGSGAYQHSLATGKTIANIDIGGGTSNIAVYRSGMLCGTSTLHIGGRLIEWFGEELKVSPIIKKWLIANELSPTKEQIKTIADEFSKVLVRVLKKDMTEIDKLLVLGCEPNWNDQIEVIMFSGGVSDCIYGKTPSTDQFNDIGKALASSIVNNDDLQHWDWHQPLETVRATVLGAGIELTEISGATIEVKPSYLPIKNVPVYEVNFHGEFNEGLAKISTVYSNAVEMFDFQQEGQHIIFYLKGLPYLKFRDIQKLSSAFITVVESFKSNNYPLLIVMESDYGKVLGQAILSKKPELPLICIDQIRVEHGDYLDIGMILQSGVVPVVVKTLTFNQ